MEAAARATRGSIHSNAKSSSSNISGGVYYSGNGVRLEGDYPIVEVVHPAASDTTSSASTSFRSGLCYYRGLFLKYAKLVLDPAIPPTLLGRYQEIINETTRQAKLLSTVATTPLTTRTSDVIERLTGLLLQTGLLTFQHLHEVIVAGSFYLPEPESESESEPTSIANPIQAETGVAATGLALFKPKPELLTSVERLLTIEALPQEQRVTALSKLTERDWALYLMISKARNRALLNVLIENPGLIGDARVRYAYMVRLQFTQPAYLMQARGIQLEKQVWADLDTAVTI